MKKIQILNLTSTFASLNEQNILEQKNFTNAINSGKILSSELESILQIMVRDTKVADDLSRAGVNTADDLINALKGNRLTGQLKGAFELSILKSNTGNIKLVELAAENLSKNQAFLQKYSRVLNNQPALEAQLKQANFSNQAITQIVNRVNPAARSATSALATSRTAASNVRPATAASTNLARTLFATASNIIKKYKKGVLDKIKKLGSRMSKKQAFLYGLLGGAGGAAIYSMFSGDKSTEGILPSCVANIPDINFVVGAGQVVVAQIPDGVDEKSSGHGGLYFWPNGRAVTKDNQVRGTYFCKTTTGGAEKVTVNEQSTNDFSKYANIQINWDADKVKPQNNTPKPKPTVAKQKFHDCENKDFPLEFGCRSSKIKEIQRCLGMEQRYQTGNFGTITRGVLQNKSFDISKGIDENIYNTITSQCNGTQSTSTEPKPEAIDPNNVPQQTQPEVVPNVNDVIQSEPDLTPQEKLQKLIDNKVVEIATAKLDPFKKVGYKYIGKDLTQDEYQNINKIMNDNGYYMGSIDTQKGKNNSKEKIRWLKNPTQPVNEDVIKKIVSKHLRSKI